LAGSFVVGLGDRHFSTPSTLYLPATMKRAIIKVSEIYYRETEEE